MPFETQDFTTELMFSVSIFSLCPSRQNALQVIGDDPQCIFYQFSATTLVKVSNILNLPVRIATGDKRGRDQNEFPQE